MTGPPGVAVPAAGIVPRPQVAVCTIVRGRQAHLRNLLRGLTLQTRPADVVVIADMGGDPSGAIADEFDLPLRVVHARSPATPLPLASARNTARRAAGAVDQLIFLDVDVIPSATLVDDYRTRLQQRPAVWSGHVDYLPEGAADPGWTQASLTRLGRANAARRRPRSDGPLPRPELFWSLSFAVPAPLFDRLGGFDEAYRGYGAEDTDFGLRTAAAGFELWRTPAARGWHQHHGSTTPPVQHLADIVVNAAVFRQRWGRWPMEGWLRAFADRGLVDWAPAGDHLALTPAGSALTRQGVAGPSSAGPVPVASATPA